MAFSAVGRIMGNLEHRLTQTRWTHFALPGSFSRAIDPSSESNYLEDLDTSGFARSPDMMMGIIQDSYQCQDWEMEDFSAPGSMQVMAVPKRKVTPYRKGIRNGPKALKPAPVIIKCKSCGRIKLPHFFCCTGDKVTGESGNSTK